MGYGAVQKSLRAVSFKDGKITLSWADNHGDKRTDQAIIAWVRV